jgi:hypothetical protein
LPYTRLRKETKAKGEERYRTLDDRLQQLQVQGVSPGQWKTERNKLQAEAEREMREWWERVSRVLETSNKEFAKWERYWYWLLRVSVPKMRGADCLRYPLAH